MQPSSYSHQPSRSPWSSSRLIAVSCAPGGLSRATIAYCSIPSPVAPSSENMSRTCCRDPPSGPSRKTMILIVQCPDDCSRAAARSWLPASRRTRIRSPAATPRTKNGVLSSRTTSGPTVIAHKPSLAAGGHPSSSRARSKTTFTNRSAVPPSGLVSSTAPACPAIGPPARSASHKAFSSRDQDFAADASNHYSLHNVITRSQRDAGVSPKTPTYRRLFAHSRWADSEVLGAQIVRFGTAIAGLASTRESQPRVPHVAAWRQRVRLAGAPAGRRRVSSACSARGDHRPYQGAVTDFGGVLLGKDAELEHGVGGALHALAIHRAGGEIGQRHDSGHLGRQVVGLPHGRPGGAGVVLGERLSLLDRPHERGRCPGVLLRPRLGGDVPADREVQGGALVQVGQFHLAVVLFGLAGVGLG